MTQTFQANSGIVDGSSAPTGYVGEWVQNFSNTGTVSPTTNTKYNVAQITLTPGDWDISAVCDMGEISGSVTYTSFAICISPTSLTFTASSTGDSQVDAVPGTITTQSDTSVSIPNWRQLVTTTTTYYLVASATINSGSVNISGRISARRMR